MDLANFQGWRFCEGQGEGGRTGCGGVTSAVKMGEIAAEVKRLKKECALEGPRKHILRAAQKHRRRKGAKSPPK